MMPESKSLENVEKTPKKKSFMRRWGWIILLLILSCPICSALLLSVFIEEGGTTRLAEGSDSGSSESLAGQESADLESQSAEDVELFGRSNWAMVATEPNDYRGARVEIVGEVFTQPEKTADSVAWQMWADPESNDWNTIVIFEDPDFKIEDGDYVLVTGEVRGERSGTNAFGAKISAPYIVAESATIVDALAAAPSANVSLEIDESHNQYGLIVTLRKVEFADDETRLFVEVENGTREEARFSSYGAKAQQGTVQYEPDYYHEYPEVLSEMLPRVKSSGVVLFPEIAATDPITFYLEAYNTDYSLDFAPYVFVVNP